jgi:putative membrane protein
MMYYEGGWWWMLLWMLGIGVIIWLIVWAVTATARRDDAGQGTSSRRALDIARERYARGEITREQFEQLKKDLL